MTSAAGHDQTFVITSDRATVGARASCEVVLPSGPPVLLELVRMGAEVELHRRRWWPFPKITLDGHRVTQGAISSGEALCIGIYELTVHLRDGE